MVAHWTVIGPAEVTGRKGTNQGPVSIVSEIITIVNTVACRER